MFRLLRRGGMVLAFVAGMTTIWFMERLYKKPMPPNLIPNPETATESHYIAALYDKDWHLRLWGAQMLRDKPSEGAIEGLVKTLQDSDPDVRDASVAALSRLGNAASQAVIPIMHSWSLEAREAAAQVLAAIGDSPALDALSTSEDDSPWVRTLAIEVIGKQKDQRFYPILAKALLDEHESVYLAAKKALLALDTPQAKAAVDGYSYSANNANGVEKLG